MTERWRTMAQSVRLDKLIWTNMKEIGYGK